MRPSWQVDLKWLFGLACLISIIAAGALYSASKLTEREPATGIFSGVMATFAKEEASEESFDDLRALAAANPDETFTIEGVTLPVKGAEIAALSYDEAVDLVVGRIANQLYTEGPDSVEQYFQATPAAGSEEGSGGDGEEFSLGPFSLLTEDTHRTAGRVFTFSLIALPVFAIPLIFFSRRFGRLGSPGVVLAAGSAPFALLWLIADQVTKDTGEEGIGGALAEAISGTAGDVSSAFLRVFVLGVALVAAAVLGHTSFALWQRLRPAPPPDPDGAASRDETEERPDFPAGEGLATPRSDGFASIGPGGNPNP